MTPEPLHVLAVGPFGRAVAQELRALAGGHVTIDAGNAADELHDSSRWPSVPRRVLAAWRPTPALSERVDATAWTWGVTWCSVMIEHPELVVGPVLRPPDAPCGMCRVRRRRQHAQRLDLDDALLHELERDPSAGPAGFLPHHAVFGAAAALRLLGDGAAGEQQALHLLDGTVSATRIAGVHGCPRCGLGRRADERSAGLLIEDLRHAASAAIARGARGG